LGHGVVSIGRHYLRHVERIEAAFPCWATLRGLWHECCLKGAPIFRTAIAFALACPDTQQVTET
jgi:hypothetical protein